MEIVSDIAAGLLVVGVAAWGVGRFRGRSRASAPERDLAARLTPVPLRTQQEARQLWQEGSRARAVVRLRRDADLSLQQAHALLQHHTAGEAVAGEAAVPSDWAQALDVLQEHRPELVDELGAVLTRRGKAAAIRTLRHHLPVALSTGYHLIEALRHR